MYGCGVLSKLDTDFIYHMEDGVVEALRRVRAWSLRIYHRDRRVRRLTDFLLSSVDDVYHSLYIYTKSYIDELILEQ